MLPAPATDRHSRLTTSLLFFRDNSERAAHHGRPVFFVYREAFHATSRRLFFVAAKRLHNRRNKLQLLAMNSDSGIGFPLTSLYLR